MECESLPSEKMEYSSQESISDMKSMVISSQESVYSLQSEKTLCTKQDIAVNELKEVKSAQEVGNYSKTASAIGENNKILGCKRNLKDQSNHKIIQDISIASKLKNLSPPNKSIRLSLKRFHKNNSISYNMNNFSRKVMLIGKDTSVLKLNKLNEDEEPQNEANYLSSERLYSDSNNPCFNCEKEISEQNSFGNNSTICTTDISNQNVQKIFYVNADIPFSLSESKIPSQDSSGSHIMDVSQSSLNSEKMDFSQETSGLKEDMAVLNKQNETEIIQNNEQAIQEYNPLKKYSYCRCTKEEKLRIRRRETEVKKREISVKNREKRVALREAAILSLENFLKIRERKILNYEAAIF